MGRGDSQTLSRDVTFFARWGSLKNIDRSMTALPSGRNRDVLQEGGWLDFKSLILSMTCRPPEKRKAAQKSWLM